MGNLLSKATKTVGKRPNKLVIMGVAGVGKTSFACAAPDPIVIGTEDGSARYGATETPVAVSIDEIEEALDDILKTDQYQTVVIDALDGLEGLCDEAICLERKVKSIEDIGYGKGVVMANERFGALVKRFENIRKSGRNVILIAHSHVKTVNDPAHPAPYDRHQLKLREKNAARVCEWADAVLFATYEIYVDSKDGRKGKGIGTGKRIMFTERRPAYEAKNRFGLPHKMELSWAEYEEAVNKDGPEAAKGLREQCLGLAEEYQAQRLENEELAIVMKKSATEAGDDVVKLRAILERIQLRIEETK